MRCTRRHYLIFKRGPAGPKSIPPPRTRFVNWNLNRLNNSQSANKKRADVAAKKPLCNVIYCAYVAVIIKHGF
jgi:hypothetical protein